LNYFSFCKYLWRSRLKLNSKGRFFAKRCHIFPGKENKWFYLRRKQMLPTKNNVWPNQDNRDHVFFMTIDIDFVSISPWLNRPFCSII
jgi:hypothetical protein